jgi:polysaccharide pyruvyl transferase WcaK-like protein
MNAAQKSGSHPGPPGAPRIGLFGKLGSGNIGNDASMQAVLRYIRAEHPHATVDAMCGGPEILKAEYGVDSVPLSWRAKFRQPRSALVATSLKVLGALFDVGRTAAWVRRHDVVIIPGMGVLETGLQTRPRSFPSSMLVLSASGRLFGTKVAFVGVGATAVKQPLTGWLLNSAARLAYYRSYRDETSREAMRQRGLNVAEDHVFTDVAFSLPVPAFEPGDDQTVCVGVMAYRGGDDDLRVADRTYGTYVAAMKRFVLWLTDNGYRVRLLLGDTNGSDELVVQEILADFRAARPDAGPDLVVARPTSSFTELMDAIQPAGSVVAIRYHNVIAALMLCKPTIAIGYSAKHETVMAGMGLAEFCQPVNPLDVDALTEMFIKLQGRLPEVRQTLLERSAAKRQLVEAQFSDLSDALFSGKSVGRLRPTTVRS